MTRDPIRRRFGKGSGRLRVGLPASAGRLSAIARRPIRYERRLTIVPVATAALVAWLLATSPLLHRPVALPEAEPIRIVMALSPARPEPGPATPEARASAEHARPAPAEKRPPRHAAADPMQSPKSTALAPSSPARHQAQPARPAPFDASVLATSAPRFEAADVLRSAEVGAPAPLPTQRRAGPSGPTDMPKGLAIASRTAAASVELARATAGASAANDSLARRPDAGGAFPAPSSDLVDAAHAGDRERGTALAALERDAAGARTRSAGSDAATRRPEVSARGSSAPVRTLASDGGRRGTALDGWQEVPLDELPDCTPPGRQDLLKKRILLAASLERECSHASGSYRFVETRTLGGFLMWSRPNPGPSPGQPRDRDACDVLERALACLGDRSSEESSSR